MIGAATSIWSAQRLAALNVNLALHSEPLLAELSAHSAGIAQAAFSENGLSNGAQFPAVNQADNASWSATLAAGTAYTVSVFVVMPGAVAPVPLSDFVLVAANTPITSGYTVTRVAGGLYRVSASVTPADVTYQTHGVYRYAGYSGQALRVTGFQVEVGALGPYQRTT